MINKAYIITTPCSGKTTFINLYENKYKILRLFDHDSFSYEKDFQVLEKLSIYSCILGGSYELNQEDYIYAIVLIDIVQLHQQIEARKRKDSSNKWTEELIFSHPEHGYHAIQQIAKKYNIPVFKTFEDALDFIIFKMIDNE